MVFVGSCAGTVQGGGESILYEPVGHGTTTHRLFQLESEFLHECERHAAGSWAADATQHLERFLDEVGEHVPSPHCGLDCEPEEVIELLRGVDRALYSAGFAICLTVDTFTEALAVRRPLGDPNTSHLSLGEGDWCRLKRSDVRDEALSRGAELGFYPMDCDLSSLFYLAAAERFGWPLQMVEVPGHNFVRWRLRNGEAVNWDTNEARSYTDEEYTQRYGSEYRSLVDMSAIDVESYYAGVVVSFLESRDCVGRIFDRLAQKPNLRPVLWNALAWTLSTDIRFAGDPRLDAALDMARSATVEDPACAYFDTLSCAYAAVGDFQSAVRVEFENISKTSPRIAHFRAGRDCFDEVVASEGGC